MTKRNVRMVVGIDPGGTTGVAWWMPARNVYGTFQYPDCNTDEGLHALLNGLSGIISSVEPFLNGAVVHIAIERFEHRPEETFRPKIDYTAGEVIGAVREWSFVRQPVIKLYRSVASAGKAFWTDDKIKALALWVPGQKHAMDAMRHLLRHRLFTLQHTELAYQLKDKI